MRDRVAVALILLLAAAHLALFIHDNTPTPLFSEDLVMVAGFLHNFSHSLQQGNLYPRWMGELFGGAGAPVFVYYGPLAFYVSSLFALPLSLDPLGVYQLGVALCAGAACSALAAYLWLRQQCEVATALLIAGVLLLLPSLFASVHLDISLAQIWAMAWFPLGLYCAQHWREQHRVYHFAGFTAVISALILTHIPSALMFCPLLGLYACLCQRPYIRALPMLILSALLATGLTAFYWLPVYANWHFAQLGRYTHFTEHYADLFLPPYTEALFFLPQLLVDASPYLVFACAAIAVSLTTHSRLPAATWLAVFATLACAVLFTPLSLPLWEHQFLFQILRAPFRLLALLYVLCPLVLLAIRQRVSLRLFIGILCMAVAADGWVVAQEYTIRLANSQTHAAMHITQQNFTAQSMAQEYKTVWQPYMTSPHYYIDSYGKLGQADSVKGAGTVQIQQWQNEHITLHVDAKSDLQLRIRQHYFPAWQAQENDRLLQLHPDDKTGLMVINIPQGEHDITLSFSKLFGEKRGCMISIITLACALGLWMLSLMAQRRNRYKGTA